MVKRFVVGFGSESERKGNAIDGGGDDEEAQIRVKTRILSG
jgi:hypothetical protein